MKVTMYLLLLAFMLIVGCSSQSKQSSQQTLPSNVQIMTSREGVSWTNLAKNIMKTIAYGNGQFVAMGTTGNNTVIQISSDGIN